jgi:hypothetical protein
MLVVQVKALLRLSKLPIGGTYYFNKLFPNRY